MEFRFPFPRIDDLDKSSIERLNRDLEYIQKFIQARESGNAGGVIHAINTVTGDTTLDSTYHVVFCNSDSAAIEITLPAGAVGTNYKIINAGTSGNDVTVTPDGSEKIYSDSDAVLADGEVVNIHFDNSEGWY